MRLLYLYQKIVLCPEAGGIKTHNKTAGPRSPAAIIFRKGTNDLFGLRAANGRFRMVIIVRVTGIAVARCAFDAAGIVGAGGQGKGCYAHQESAFQDCHDFNPFIKSKG